MLTQDTIDFWAKYTLELCGRPELFKILDFSYCPTMTRKLGSALLTNKYAREDGQWKTLKVGEIKLSKPWYGVIQENDKINTVIHEVCHIVADYDIAELSKKNYCEFVTLNFDNERNEGHGKYWKELMQKCGLPPNSCAKIDEKIDNKVTAYCLCNEWKISKQRAGRIRNSTSAYYCKKCKANLSLKPRVSA